MNLAVQFFVLTLHRRNIIVLESNGARGRSGGR